MKQNEHFPFRLILDVSDRSTSRRPRRIDSAAEVEKRLWASRPRFVDSVVGADRTAKAVGIWDIEGRLAYLYPLLKQFNDAQEDLVFFELLVPVPVGLTARPERIERLLRQSGLKLDRKDRESIRSNVVAGDIFVRAAKVRRLFDLDYLVGIVGPPIFDEDDYNLFATARKREALVSTEDLDAYSNKAGVIPEVAVGYLIFSTVSAMLVRELGYHDQQRSCPFDYDEARDTVVDGLRKLTLCAECAELIRRHPKGEALMRVLESLRSFSRTAPEAGHAF